MKKVRNLVVLLLVLSTVLSGCGKAAGSGTLKVGVRDDIMNLGYLNPATGEYYGLEIDLARNLADRLGYADVTFVAVDPDSRRQMLLDGSVDCVIAAYSIAETRLANFDFSPSYYTDYSCIMVEKSSGLQSMEDMVGKKFGVLDGADTAPKLAAKMKEMGLISDEDLKNTSLEKMGSYGELSKALEEGAVDAVSMDGCISRAYMDDDRMILDAVIGQEDYGVATQKDSALSKPVAEAVQKMLDDGTIAGLIDKWD